MGKKVLSKGKSIEEAIENALRELNATSEDVETKILEIPTSGFMGIGHKLAKVEVTLKDKSDNTAKEFIESILKEMKIDATLQVSIDEENCMNIKISSDDMGILIGKRGQTLDSLQYLTSLVVNKSSEDYIRVNVDINNYRDKRKKTLENLASNLAKKAISTKRPVSLEPMNPYERRIIHSFLQDFDNITTKSEGEGSNRHLVIFYSDK